MERGPTLQCRPALHYAMQSITDTNCTELVPLKYGKLARKYPRIYGYFYSVARDPCTHPITLTWRLLWYQTKERSYLTHLLSCHLTSFLLN